MHSLDSPIYTCMIRRSIRRGWWDMRSRLAAVSFAALLASCNQASIYDQPIPDAGDSKTLIEIRDNIKPEDRDAWQSITMAKMNPMAKKIDAKTVGEAIQRFKARRACMAAHDTDKVPPNNLTFDDPGYDAAAAKRTAAYNAEAAAYNDCLKMPL